MSETEQLRFRRTVESQGFSIVYHVLTLDTDLSDGAFRLYVLLLKYAQQSGTCWPGVDRLAADLGKKPRTILYHLAELTERGLISRERRPNRSSITWIEDLETVYGKANQETDGKAGGEPDRETDEENCAEEAEEETDAEAEESAKFCTEQMCDVQNFAHPGHAKFCTSEEQQENNNNAVAVGPAAATTTATTTAAAALLRDFGVDPVTARTLVARGCSEDQVRGWIAYARQAKGLSNPAGFVVSRLQLGASPPAPVNSGADEQRQHRRRFIEGEYAEFIMH